MKAISFIPVVALSLVIAGIVTAAGLNVLVNFQETECSGNYDDNDCRSCPTNGACTSGCTYNATANNCYNSSGGTAAYVDATSAAFNATGDAMDGTTEISGQFTTIGIISAMVIILMIIGGLTAYVVV